MCTCTRQRREAPRPRSHAFHLPFAPLFRGCGYFRAKDTEEQALHVFMGFGKAAILGAYAANLATFMTIKAMPVFTIQSV